MGITKRLITKDPPPVREVTKRVYDCLLADDWPSAAGVLDFGLKTAEHFGALRHAVRCHGVTLEELDDALGDGPAITALVRVGNPYAGVAFETPWDDIMISIKGWAGVDGRGFPLGRLFATPKALMEVSRADIQEALRQHAAGRGEGAGVEEEVILSSHESRDGQEFVLRTEADRSMTLVSLPEEYGI